MILKNMPEKLLKTNHLKKHKVFYIDCKTLISILKKENTVDYKHLGLILNDNKCPICMYLYKSNKRNRGGKRVLFVDLSSYDKRRIKIIEYYIETFIANYVQLDFRETTAYENISVSSRFISWADENDYDFLKDIDNARQIYSYFVLYLKQQIRIGNLSTDYANKLQVKSIKLLEYIHDDRSGFIKDTIESIPKDYSFESKTNKSNINDKEYVFKFYFHLFNQIADFLLEGKSYPFKLKLPRENLWVLPYTLSYFVKPSYKRQKIVSFNYKEGRIRTLEEIEQGATKKEFAKQYLSDFIENLEYNNFNINSDKRLFLGTIALKAYYMHFLSITGMNDSVVGTLPMCGDFEVIKDRQRYRTIKYRASRKVVEFELGHYFVKYFYKFLKLREFILNDNEFEYLFFEGHGTKIKLSSKQKKGGYSSFINDKMTRYIDDKLPIINSRTLRIDKTYYNIKKHGIVTAAEMAQNTLSVILKTYTAENQESSSVQLTNYFNKLNEHIFDAAEDDIDISIGHCNKVDDPKSEIKLNSISIDCKQKEGCLFCESYRCHADKEDIRKLFSLKFIINECKYIAKNEEHFKSVYSPIINRIDEIIRDIENLNIFNSQIIRDIKKDVFENENLHPYWEFKLKTLINMGVLK
jgi:hypothetical protein